MVRALYTTGTTGNGMLPEISIRGDRGLTIPINPYFSKGMKKGIE
jgi:hypothetical protein